MPISDEKNGPLVVAAQTNLRESLAQCVVQSGSARGQHLVHGVKEFVSIVCEVLSQNGLVGKRHKKDFVILVNAISEPIHGIDGGTELSFHTAAGVQEHADANRHIVVLTEMRNFLGSAVFLDEEIFGGQVADITAAVVSDRRYDIYEPDINADLRNQNSAGR